MNPTTLLPRPVPTAARTRATAAGPPLGARPRAPRPAYRSTVRALAHRHRLRLLARHARPRRADRHPRLGERLSVCLSLTIEGLALLAFGLVRPWGERAPRWLPLIGARRVPPRPVIAAAATGTVLVTFIALMCFVPSDSIADLEATDAGRAVAVACVPAAAALGADARRPHDRLPPAALARLTTTPSNIPPTDPLAEQHRTRPSGHSRTCRPLRSRAFTRCSTPTAGGFSRRRSSAIGDPASRAASR